MQVKTYTKSPYSQLILLFGTLFLLQTTAYSQIPTLDWARTFGSTGVDEGYSVTTDNNGNVFSCGRYRGNMDINPNAGIEMLNYHAAYDIYVQKLDANGGFLWGHGFGNTFSNNNDEAFGIAVDQQGNCYVTGYFQWTVDFDPDPLNTVNLSSNGVQDIFILKLDPNGNFVWVKQIGGTGEDAAKDIAIDDSGNLYLTGYFSGIVDFDPNGPVANQFSWASSQDIFILKLNSNGDYQWAKTIGTNNFQEGKAIDVDADGNCYVTGRFNQLMDFNPDPLVTDNIFPSNYDGFVLKLRNDGSYAWAKKIGGVLNDRGVDLAVGATGNVYTTGLFESTVDFDPDPGLTHHITATHNNDVFVQKLDSGGVFQWAINIDGSTAEYASSIALDDAENVYTSGRFTDVTDFDPDPISTYNINPGGHNFFIQKLSSNAAFAWAISLGETNYNGTHKIHVDHLNNVYATGHFQQTVDFDPGSGTDNHTSNGGANDAFVMKLGQSGPLGVDMLDINSSCENGTVKIGWSTMSETNNDYFMVEKSSNLIEWQEIKRIAGAGNANTIQNYGINTSSTLSQPYYRITQVDFDGSTTSYDPIFEYCKAPNAEILIYPNPTLNEFQIQTQGVDTFQITVMDISGKVFINQQATNSEVLSLSSQPTGVYLVRIQIGELSKTFKLIKK